MNQLRGLFWRVAHARYNGRSPSRFFEVMWYCYAGMFAILWVFALATNWSANQDNLLSGALVVTVPLLIGLGMRKVRNERAKGSDALYRKRVQHHG